MMMGPYVCFVNRARVATSRPEITSCCSPFSIQNTEASGLGDGFNRYFQLKRGYNDFLEFHRDKSAIEMNV